MATFEGMTEEDQLNTLMAELKDSNIRQSVMEYIANKSEVTPGTTDKQRLSKMIETIAAESVTNQKQSALWKSRTKKSILLGIVAVIVAITVQFLVNFFSNELSKESHVTGGTMVGTDGSVVKTQNDDTSVNADGQMVGRGGKNVAKTIKTTPSLNQVALASSLPDTTLMALDEITVYSDKGHTLRVKVMGFSRVPVLNSRCGNLVHFYTAWNGRITLDSTDLSFDKATEGQFKDAGFSLAVGGFGGRKLAGGTRSNAFFKHVDKMKKSGSWTCADVPLPTTFDTYMSRESSYEPCKGHACYSDFGGLKLGVAKIAEAHALAAMSVTSHMRALLKGTATEVFYTKFETTNIVSPSYLLEIKTMPNHYGQEKITLIDRATDQIVTFQVAVGDTKAVAYCQAVTDDSLKTKKKALADPAVDSDVHMEFRGLVEEDGKVLRHWLWTLSASLSKATGGNGEIAGEYWDFADTLMSYRMLDGTGSVYITESFSSKCTDADVTAALSLRTSASIKDLQGCKAPKADEGKVPKMESPTDDLDEDVIVYYTQQVFGDYDAVARVAATGEDDALTRVADYLLRGEKGWSLGSVSDPCYLACKDVMDVEELDRKEERDPCTTGSHDAVIDCLSNAHTECPSMPWVSVVGLECEVSKNENRALEDEDEEFEGAAALVPTGKDGVADLFRSSPTFQAAVAQSLGAAMPKVTINATRPTRQRNARQLAARRRLIPDCTIYYCGECWSQPKNAKGKPAGSSVQQGGGCNTCRWGLCFFSFKTKSFAGGSTLNMGQFLCLSFSLCLTEQITVVVYIKFQTFNGIWMFSIICEICCGDYQMAMGVPDPWYFECCLGGQLHIFLEALCKDNGRFRRGGGCYLRHDINIVIRFGWKGFGFEIMINVVSIEVGVQWGHAFHKWRQSYSCVKTDGPRRRRRRGGNPRRRRTHHCQWRRQEACDSYTRWYVHIVLCGKIKFGYECYEWTKAKMKEGFIFGEWDIPKGIKWRGLQWKWCRFSKFCCFRKYNRR